MFVLGWSEFEADPLFIILLVSIIKQKTLHLHIVIIHEQIDDFTSNCINLHGKLQQYMRSQCLLFESADQWAF